MTDRDTGRSRGFGFITYEAKEDAEEVCRKKFYTINEQVFLFFHPLFPPLYTYFFLFFSFFF